MPPDHTPGAVFYPRLIHDPRQDPPRLPLIARARQIQPRLTPPAAVIDPRQFQPDQTQTDPPVPGPPYQPIDHPVNVRLQIRWLLEALAPPALLHVIVTQPHLDTPDHLSVGPHLGHQMIRHPAQHAPHKFFIRGVLVERLLLPVRLGIFTLGHDRTLVDALGKLPQPPRPRARDQFQTLHRRLRHLRNAVQTRRLEYAFQLRPHPRQPLHLERREKFPLRPRRHLEKIIRLAQLRSHGRDQLVRPQPLRDRQTQMLADIAPQALRRRARTPFCHPRQIPVALVDRPHLHDRCVIVDQGKHQPRKMFILLIIPRQHDEVRTNLQGPRRRHRGVNPQLARLITGRSNNPPRHPPHRNRLPAQAGLGRHLASDKKGIRIQMDRRPLFHPLHPADLARNLTTVQMFTGFSLSYD